MIPSDAKHRFTNRSQKRAVIFDVYSLPFILRAKWRNSAGKDKVARVTITLRGALVGGLAVALSIGLYLLWLWRPEHQVRLNTEHFFHAIDGRNWETVADFISDDYRDQWADDRTRLLERMREGFRWVRGSRITAANASVQVETPRAIWVGKIMVYSSDDGVMEVLDERVNKLTAPFEFEWRRISGKPWDWKLVRVSNPAFQIPADAY